MQSRLSISLYFYSNIRLSWGLVPKPSAGSEILEHFNRKFDEIDSKHRVMLRFFLCWKKVELQPLKVFSDLNVQTIIAKLITFLYKKPQNIELDF